MKRQDPGGHGDAPKRKKVKAGWQRHGHTVWRKPEQPEPQKKPPASPAVAIPKPASGKAAAICPSRTWEPSTARFLEKYGDSNLYFCYDKKGNGGAVCGMHNSGIAPPDGGTWGTNQPDCSRAECGWPGISKDDCVAQNCRWDEVGPRKGAATFKCFYVGNTFGKQCSSDMCGDYNKDCCAPGSEPRKCTVPGYKVVAGGISKAASCLKDNGPSGVYQCCKPN